MLEGAGGVETVQPGVEPGDVLGAVRAPVVQAGLQRHAVGQPVRDGEAAAALQLGQHDDDLSVERRNTVHCPQLCSGGHNIVRLVAITPHLTHLCDHGSYLTVLMLLLDVW